MENNIEKIEEINLTKLITDKYMSFFKDTKPEDLTAIAYYLDVDLDKKLGKHIVYAEDVDITTTREYKDGINVIINNIYTSPDPLTIRIGAVYNENEVSDVNDILEYINPETRQFISGYIGDDEVFNIHNENNSVTNSLNYTEDNTVVNDQYVIDFKGRPYDANSFYFRKTINGALRYDGSLDPVFSNGYDGFDFHFGSEEKKKHASMLQWILQTESANSLINVGISDEKHRLVNCCDRVFLELERQLIRASAKVEEEKLTKKRVLENK